MALLDMQGLETTRGSERWGGGEGGGSELSVLLCDSFASTTLCL
ncbi:MAG TPA: SapB/AmfS family lanthipeptide [Trebonia sp.]|jgi:lanthionine-containing peptide SapB|nr:SapB/AmfS family lanthipeptide [Trebonia sp.]